MQCRREGGMIGSFDLAHSRLATFRCLGSPHAQPSKADCNRLCVISRVIISNYNSIILTTQSRHPLSCRSKKIQDVAHPHSFTVCSHGGGGLRHLAGTCVATINRTGGINTRETCKLADWHTAELCWERGGGDTILQSYK
jgi:hypothetical protein